MSENELTAATDAQRLTPEQIRDWRAELKFDAQAGHITGDELDQLRALCDLALSALRNPPSRDASEALEDEAKDYASHKAEANAALERAAKVCEERARLREGEIGWDQPGSAIWAYIQEAKRCRDSIRRLALASPPAPAERVEQVQCECATCGHNGSNWPFYKQWVRPCPNCGGLAINETLRQPVAAGGEQNKDAPESPDELLPGLRLAAKILDDGGFKSARIIERQIAILEAAPEGRPK